MEDEGQQLIRDPFLISILQTANSLRAQTLALLDLTSQQRERRQGLKADQGDDNDDSENDSSPINDPELLKQQKQLAGNLALLRGQNRRLAHTIRSTKSATSTARLEVDRLHLSLQNLYYEQRHLRGEIRACEEYPHAYTQLPLISEDEFLQKYPDWEHKREGTQMAVEEEENRNGGFDEEGLMRARIKDEHREREGLESQRQLLVKRKMELVKENAKRKEELVKLDKELEAFVEAAQKIQKTFEKET